MSEVKTMKAEAIELLSKKDITGNVAIRLNTLTAQQAGIQVVEYPNGSFGLEDIDGQEFPAWQTHYSGDEAWADAPDYVVSIDACVTLPIPGMMWDDMQVNADYTGAKIRLHQYGNTVFVGKGEAKTLPIAMLKAWWSIQSD